MEQDPLAAFRKTPLTDKPLTGGSPPVKVKEGYLAFGAKDKVDRLKIRRATNPTRSPGYHYLLDVVYDDEYGMNFVLVYTFLMVMVRGQNLQSVVFALETSQADFIQEFDPARWNKPADKTAPFIEAIEVIVQDSAQSTAAADKGSDTRH